MVQQLKASRSGTKGHMTRSIGLINGYANKVMNQQEANSLEVLEGKLKGLYETYVIASRDILEKLRASKATPEELDEEQTITLQTQDEVLGARAIIKQKKQEWLDDERDRRLLTLFQATNQASNLAGNQAANQATSQAQMAQLIAQIVAAIPAPPAPVINVTAAPAPATAVQSIRLPQRQIKHFRGDVLEWTQFWESFNAAVHSSSLSNVQKFDYLKEYLKGEAYLLVNNLELTDANYQVAIDELKRMTDVLIDAHFEKLDALQPVKDGNDVPALRSFQLNLQSHISALETLGVPTSSFGGLLGSRLIKLIPSRLQLEWAKSATNKTTDIEMVIKFIGEQIDAAERYNRIKGVEKEKSSPAPKQPKPANPPPATASQLAVGAKASPAPQVKSSLKTKNVKFNPSWIVCERPCIFCSEIHWPTKCPKGLAERKKIIFDLKRCVNCFGSKHELKDCTSTRNCNKCGGRHHTSLCDKGDVRVSNPTTAASIMASSPTTTTTACASTFGQLMLKTATVIISGQNGNETRAILFADDGSHRSWVLKSLSSQLNMKTVAVENISTRVFKKKEPSKPEMTKNVEMQVRDTWQGAPKVTLMALESDHIADTGPYVGSEFASSLWIQNEKLADDRFEMAHTEEQPIGILVGMDQMFQIMPNEAAIQSPCGLRAFQTKLGRMIAGPSQEKNRRQELK
jgi:hypothetical protein